MKKTYRVRLFNAAGAYLTECVTLSTSESSAIKNARQILGKQWMIAGCKFSVYQVN